MLVPGLDEGIMPPLDFMAYGSGPPWFMICLRLTNEAATMAKVVRTAPMPQEKTRAVLVGSVSRMTRRYASR